MLPESQETVAHHAARLGRREALLAWSQTHLPGRSITSSGSTSKLLVASAEGMRSRPTQTLDVAANSLLRFECNRRHTGIRINPTTWRGRRFGGEKFSGKPLCHLSSSVNLLWHFLWVGRPASAPFGCVPRWPWPLDLGPRLICPY